MAERTSTRAIDVGPVAGAGSANGASAPPPGPTRRRPARRTMVVVAGIVVVGGAIAAVRAGGGDDAVAATRTAATGTARAEERDLVVADAYEGRLGFGTADAVQAGRAGVVTTVAAVGTTVSAGQALFSIDLQPTVLLTGDVPAFRQLDVDSSGGADVRQLEQALVDLGFGGGITVDEDFTSATATAVKAWEKALGRPEPDGVVPLGDVAFAPGPVRISEITASVGTQVKSEAAVVQATPTTKVVTMDLGADAANRLELGAAVGLELADGRTTTGRIAAIATAATPAATGGGPGGGPTVAVTVAFDDPAAADGMDSGTVDVTIERSRVDGATAVPVTALLALAEGGYAVEVVDNAAVDGTRLVGVTVGTYADGFVEVEGDGISPGTAVVVPR